MINKSYSYNGTRKRFLTKGMGKPELLVLKKWIRTLTQCIQMHKNWRLWILDSTLSNTWNQTEVRFFRTSTSDYLEI